ncbi:MAG: CAP domain-containing protein [Candidatus Beckwithbacteria bacterium]
MTNILANLFTPQVSNNYKAKTLHLSSLSIFMLIIMISQILFTFFGRKLPGVLGMISTITAEELVNLTNQQRQEANLPALELNSTLSQAAQQKAADMIAKNYWAHTGPDGTTPWVFFKNAGYRYLYAGENLARDFYDSGSVVKAWMNSPTHKDNIMSSRYREIGIAVVQDTFQGQETVLVVQLFGTQTVAVVAPVKIGEISQAAEAVLAEVKTNPVINSFQLTKAMSISLTIILLAVIVIDSIVITRKKIVRLSGKGLAHLIFLGVLLIILLGIQPGLVL